MEHKTLRTSDAQRKASLKWERENNEKITVKLRRGKDPGKDQIRAAAADVVFVCLGAPKQELWMAKMAGKLPLGLMVGLGGSLDVFAGTVKRAPVAWQKLDLEWLYRLIKEPRRIGRMMKLPLFVLEAAGERLRGK